MEKRIVALIAVLALLFAGIVVTTNSSEGAEDVPDGTEAHPYVQNVSIPVGGTKVVYITLNLTAFEFVKKGDGYHISYGVGSETKKVEAKLDVDNGSIPDWSESNTITRADISVKPIKVDEYGTFGFSLTLNSSSAAAACSVDLCFSIISLSVVQSIYYKINVTEESSTSYEVTFPDVTLNSDGLIDVQGTLKVGNVLQDDLSNYSFYAVGLYPGVAIHNDLTITGRADTTTSAWSSGSPMEFKVVISDKNSKSTVTVDSSVKYTITPTDSTLNFSIVSGTDTKLDNNSTETSVSILSGTELVLNVTGGTEASVVFTDSSSKVSTRMLYSTATTAGQETLDTDGNGSYQIVLTKAGSTEQKTVTVNIIPSMVAMNSIRVTCGPL